MLKLTHQQWDELEQCMGRTGYAAHVAEQLQKICDHGDMDVPAERLDTEVMAGMRWALRCGLTARSDTVRLIALVCGRFGGFDTRRFPVAERTMLLDRRIPAHERLDALGDGLPEVAYGGALDEYEGPDELVATCPESEPAQPWIEIRLRDAKDGTAAAGEEYLIVLPDGVEARGYLDANGRARVTDLDDSGECQITFPRLDASMWERT